MNKLINKIKEEYSKGFSAKEVGENLGVSEKMVRYWMNKGEIKARSWSDATYKKRNPDGDPFKIIDNIKSHYQLLLFFIGIGLYLGEGTKQGKHKVALGNTNPDILKTFLYFLRIICGVKENKIRAELNIFDDVNKTKAISYWSKNIGITKKQIRHVFIRKSKGGSYKKKSKYGTLTLLVCNSKLKQIILEWCTLALKDCIMPL
ncbi:hypothetical protein ACFL52_01245 [Candidatus Margulisiibacteriota bacterium]